MPSTYMPLKSAFVAAAKEGIHRTEFDLRLLRHLQNGSVRAVCASYIKAQFRFCCMGSNYAEVIDQLIVPANCKLDAKKNRPTFVDGCYNLWIDGDYYTFLEIERGVVTYADQDPHLAPGGELNLELLANALINEDRSEIFCFDVPNQRRRTYERVELLRSDVNNMLGLLQDKVAVKRGAKRKYYLDERVYELARSLLRMNYSRTEWEGRVREAMSETDQEMKEKTFHDLYGRPLWTAHNDRKRGN